MKRLTIFPVLLFAIAQWVYVVQWAYADCEITHWANNQVKDRIYPILSAENEQALMHTLKHLPDKRLSFSDKEQFLTYTSEIQPLLGRDYMAVLAANVPDRDLSRFIHLPDFSETMNSPSSYLSLFAHIGGILREAALHAYGVDLASLAIGKIRTEKFQLESLPFRREFPEISGNPLSDQEITALNALLVKSLHRDYLADKGFDLPVVFTGFVPYERANVHVVQSLFADDPIFTGNFTHGKWIHAMVIAMLFKKYPELNPTWLKQMVEKGNWEHLLDNVSLSVADPTETIALRCQINDKVIERQWQASSWPNAQNPITINQMLMKRLYSQTLLQNGHSQSALQTMLAAIGVKVSSQEQMAENIRALENFTILDFVNDIHTVFRLRRFFDKKWALDYVATLCRYISPGDTDHLVRELNRIGYPAEELDSDNRSCDGHLQLVYALTTIDDESRFTQALISSFLTTQSDLKNFYRQITDIFKPIRAAWLKEQGIAVMESGDPAYLIYRLPEPDFNPTCGFSDKES